MSSRALQEIREIDEPAVGVDQVALHRVERLPADRRRQVGVRGIARHGVAARVHGLLRLDCDEPQPILPAHEEPLDLHVLQHLLEVALVRREQRVVDLAIAVRQLAVEDRVADHEVRMRCADVLEQTPPRRDRDEIERMVLALVDEARVDLGAREPRERLFTERIAQPRHVREADASALLSPVREHPREAVERAAIGAGVHLERALQRLEHRALRAAVRTDEQDELVDATEPREPGDRLVQLVLRLFLADQPVPAVELAVEQAMPRDLARRRADVAATEVVERILDELRRAPGVHRGLAAQDVEPLVEAENASRRLELLGHRVGQGLDPLPGVLLHGVLT
jgi:hypothetical protein